MQDSQSFPYKKVFATVALIVGVYFFYRGLTEAQGFLIPLTIAGVLALVIYPVAKRLEKWKLSRTFSSLISVVLLFIISASIISVVLFQFKNFANEWPSIKENMGPKVTQLKSFMTQNTPFSEEELENYTDKSMGDLISSIQNPEARAIGILSSTGGFLGKFLLTFVYIFFILRYRRRFINFILVLMPDKNPKEIQKTAFEIPLVISGYLSGQLILMGALCVAYIIGLGISGVNNFILISIVATLLTLIPYLGNIVGFSLAFAFGYLTSGEFGVLIGVVLTFTISQFLETYVLQPYVMGERVNLHPFLVVIMVILGGAVWGLAGMVIAVPMSAITATLMMHIPRLRVFGLAFQNKPLRRSDQS